MTSSRLALLRVASVAVASLAAASASQAASTWSFADTSPPAPCVSSSGGFTCTATDTSTTVAVTAWSNSGSGSTYAAAQVGTNDPNGFGVINGKEGTGSPQHAMDNIAITTNGLTDTGFTDALLLSFSTAVKLTDVQIGWKGSDSDITVMRYTGSTAPSLAGVATANLASSGWSLVGSYADLAVASNMGVNAGGFSSSWWLISAYNSTFGGTGTNLSAGDDAVKLLSVAGTPVNPPRNGVPEPTSLALAGVALLGMVGAGRRRKR